MTGEELKRARHIRNEIDILAKKLAELKQRSLIGGGKMDGMPRSQAGGDRVAEAAIREADLEAMIQEQLEQLIEAEAEIMRFIRAVDDSMIRQTLFLRYISCMSWNQIARRIGGGNTADSCRMMSARFLEQQDVRFVRPDDDTMQA